MAEETSRKPPSFKVSDQLLDLMAKDDSDRHLAAVEKLQEKRKITMAENYLRRKFRRKVLLFVLSDEKMCATLDQATLENFHSLLQEAQPTPSSVARNRPTSEGERSSQVEKRKQSEADEEEQACVSHVGCDVTEGSSSAESSRKRLCASKVQT